jgi:muramoyltetrapeptide carboxypeptidase
MMTTNNTHFPTLLAALSVLLMLPLTLMAQQRHIVMPRFLKPGDRIAIVSPCSQPEEKTVLEGCDILRQWGYEPVVASHALSYYHGFAGTTEERVSDLL